MDDVAKAEFDRRYTAFISYRHVIADRNWAKWLVEALETYRTPRALVRRGFPSRIGLVYRDEDENPASAELGEQIEQALRASDTLIVVASRSTPESRWIDREVARFEELGRRDRILVLLTDGEPMHAYPPALLKDPEREPIAADVRPRRDESQRLLNRRARLRLVAALLRCSFDDLYRRDRRRTRRRWLGLSALITVLVLAGAGAFLSGEQARERLRLDRTALAIQRAPETEVRSDRRGAAMFAELSTSGWPFVTLPESARETLGTTIRKSVVTRLRFDREDLPVVLEPLPLGVLVGLSDGRIFAVENRARLVVPAANCTGSDAGFMRCAVTALDVLDGRAVAGTHRGEVILFDTAGRAPARRIVPSSLRIEAVARRSDGAIVADAAGTLYRIGDGGATAVVALGGGSVASLIEEPGGALLVVRVGGRIERLGAVGTLTPLARYDGPVRGAALLNGRFYLMRTASNAGPDRSSFLEGTIEHAVAMSDAAPVSVDRNLDGVFFGLRGRQVAYGKGTDVRLFDVTSRSIETIGLDPTTFDDDAREIAFSFYGSIAASGDGRRLYSIDYTSRALIVIDLDALARIDAMLLGSRNVRRDLCRLDMRRAFLTLGLPVSTCGRP